MKEDILEQLVEDWLQAKGYFTRANLKFRPAKDCEGYDSKRDSVASDIDVVGIHPGKVGAERVYVVNCKSWQQGFPIAKTLRDLGGKAAAKLGESEEDPVEAVGVVEDKPGSKLGGRDVWKHFRELVRDRWSTAFLTTLREVAHSGDQFTYVTAVTFARDPQNKELWEGNPDFKKALKGNPIRFLTLRDMLGEVFPLLGTSVESSQFSRTLQLFKAAKITLSLDAEIPPQKTARKSAKG